jgi:DNA ligase D-like protein (predicted polymerase)
VHALDIGRREQRVEGIGTVDRVSTQARGDRDGEARADQAGDGETRDGVKLTHLDAELFADAGATKRDLVDYLDGVSGRILPVLTDRPLSVIRVMRGQDAFMQKNVPKYTPEWVRTVTSWAETSKRDVRYAVADDRRTLLWFANQRAVEYHPALVLADHPQVLTHLVLDLDPPEGAGFDDVVAVAHLVRRVLDDAGLAGAVKTSGAKGLHVFVPLDGEASHADAAAALRALAARTEQLDPSIATTAFVKDERGGKVFVDATRAGGATVVAAYSPRLRPGVPVSFPVGWDDLDGVRPADFTIHTALDALGGRDPWAEHLPAPQHLDADLVAEGHEIPVARVEAMHEGKRRSRARRT